MERTLKPSNSRSHCPNCDSTNLQTEPLYDWDEGVTDEVGLFCVSCGHYLGELPNLLKERGENLHSQILSQLGDNPNSFGGNVE